MKCLRSCFPSLIFIFAMASVQMTGEAKIQQQQSPAASQDATRQDTSQKQSKDGASSSGASSSTNSNNGATSSTGKQPKRILGIIPNYRAVSANTTLPPQTVRQKFWLATEDSFDYSSFILTAAVAGLGQAQKSVPEFGQGASGYGRYYWHSFVDQAVGDYYTEAIVPTLTHEDPRYYTLGKGSFLHRTGYALSRLVVTRSDSGHKTFNFSEILGNGAGAATSNLYYPSQERTFGKTAQKWGLQVGIDGIFNVFKEFWPDIDQKLFKGKY
ncbi:MAG: hypothetical protein ACREDR_47390 [Blastocatellia bacterium]